MSASPLLVDSHCHLNMVAEKGIAIDDAVQAAQDNGVGVLLTICTHMKEAEEVIAIAERYPNVYATVGIHPHTADKEEAEHDTLLKYASHPKVIGLGETGLDYYYENSSRENQQRSFHTHCSIARETGLPVVVHSRDADEETISIIEEELRKGEFPFLIHCFSSGKYLAEKSVKLGGYISLSGILTFKNSQELRDIAQVLPLERLLVETDAPFLAPVPFRGKTNQPAYTKHTAECLAELKGISLSEVAKQTTDNFFTLFTKASRAG